MKKIPLLILVLFTSLVAETISVRVTKSTPIYRQSYVQVPHTTYTEEQVQVPYNCRRVRADKNSIGIDTVIGAVAGVVIGNQIGAGNGRTAAKIVGGLGGSYIANNMREGHSETCYRMEFRSVPHTTYTTETRERLVAYKNCGQIGGRTICKKTKNKQRYIYLNY